MTSKPKFTLGDDAVNTAPTQPQTKVAKEIKDPEFYIFQLVTNDFDRFGNPQFPETYSLAPSATLEDSNGNQRAAKYIVGVPTLWVDEQKDLPEGLKKKRADIVFHRGLLKIQSANKSLVKFLLERPDCEQSKSSMKTRVKYKLLNFADIEKASLVKTQRKYDAMKMALNAEGEHWLSHAQFLGVKPNNQYGVPKSEVAIRKDYVEMAEKNPDVFMQTVANPLVDAFTVASKAITKGIINIGKVKGQAIWGDSGTLICILNNVSAPSVSIAEHFLSKRGEADYATTIGLMKNIS